MIGSYPNSWYQKRTSIEMKIRIKESSTVRPIQDTPNHRLWVANIDLFHAKYHVPLLFLYKPNGSGSLDFFETEKLKQALTKVLVPFYPVAGRLARDSDGRIEINCNGEGGLFIEVETDSAMGDFGDFKPTMEFRRLIPTVDYTTDISSYPLLVAQVTRFRCGGVCLGVGWHHTLADGTACLHFLNTWSDIARGLSVKIPPSLDRTILRGRVPPSPTFHHIEYDPFPTLKPHLQNDSSSKDITVSNLEITPDLLNTLTALTVHNNASKTKYSTYVILTAHIWRCACKARGLSHDQTTKLCMPTSGRFRLRPPLPPGYLGNAIFLATPNALSGDLLSEPLVDTAERIHRAIKRMDDEYLKSAVDYLEKIDDLTTIMRSSETYKSPNLNINNWMQLPFYDADFGWGKPLYVRAAFAFEGKVYLLPRPTDDVNFSLIICLQTNHMQAFKKNFYLDHRRGSCM